MSLTRRAERSDPSTLLATFVDVGALFTMLSSEDHQILFGRRGTGKTHALQYLSATRRNSGDIVVYVDMRTIGSTGGIYSDPGIPVGERGTRLLVDTLSNVFNVLTEEVLSASFSSDVDFSAAMDHIDQLGDSLTEVRITGDEERETTLEVARVKGANTDFGVDLGASPSLTARVGSTTSEDTHASVRRAHRGPLRHRVHFGSVASSISGVVDGLQGRLWVLLDEWSDVPLDLQPLLADLIRRCLMPVRGITVKIGAIEQRSNFRQPDGAGGYIGLELGADVSADVDLDDFMVFGNDPEKAKTFFRELMFRHVNAVIPEYSRFASSAEFVRGAFTQSTAFDEFVRAAEGVPRDAINIGAVAAQHAGEGPISVPIVRSAARRWYLRDKEKAVEANEEAIQLLHWVIDEVIAGRKARAFLLRQGAPSNDPLIGSLYDARVMHVIKRGVSAHDQPGVRYNVYALDYGCYVELISTASEPRGLLPLDDAADEPIYVDVPPDDYRSIRRAILDLDEYRRHQALTGATPVPGP